MMKKTYGFMMGAAIVVAGGLTGAAMMPSAATAAIAVNDDGSLKLFGDARLRYEYDKRKKSDNITIQHRDRFRLRARFGALYAPNDFWSMGLRLRTSSKARNSPHQTAGFFGSVGNNQDFGLDRVFIKIKTPLLGGKLSVWGGKNGMNLWQQDEVWWDEDIQPEGAAITYKTSALPVNGSLTLNVGGFVLSEASFVTSPAGGHDGKLVTLQGVYQIKIFGSKLTVAETFAEIVNPNDLSAKIGGGTLQASKHLGTSVQLKGSNWRIGADYINSDATQQDLAYVIQGRYKPAFLHGIGFRVYYYRVEGFSVLGDGIFSQDNFANPGNYGVSNFRGTRLQIDYKINKHTSIDLRAYLARRIVDPNTIGGQVAGTVTDALMTDIDRKRYQVNLNMKF